MRLARRGTCALSAQLLGIGLCVLAVGMPVQSAACKPKGAAPAPLDGTWEVVRVAVDQRDQPHWYYRPGDPRLLGRELVIDGTSLHLNGGFADSCADARWKSRKTTWGQLLAESFRRSPSHDLPTAPAPADFGSKLAKGAAVSVSSLVCAPAQTKRRADPWASAWFVSQGPDTLAVRLDSSALLILSRLSATSKPHASFECAAASTAVEKAVCGQTGLAGLDRSVAQAYAEALERQPSATLRLREEQTTWLLERDRCGSDAACLEEKMAQRIDALAQE